MAMEIEDILKAAGQLGALIAGHPVTQRFAEISAKVKSNAEAQRLIDDYSRQAEAIAQKEAEQKPIEVEDKHKLADLQSQIAMHPLLRELPAAQMDYLDLMRKVDEAIASGRRSG